MGTLLPGLCFIYLGVMIYIVFLHWFSQIFFTILKSPIIFYSRQMTSFPIWLSKLRPYEISFFNFPISLYIYKTSLGICHSFLVLFAIGGEKDTLLFAEIHWLLIFYLILYNIPWDLFPSPSPFLCHTTTLLLIDFPVPHTLIHSHRNGPSQSSNLLNCSLLLTLIHIHTILTVYNLASATTNFLKLWINPKHQIQLSFLTLHPPSPFNNLLSFPYFLEYSIFLTAMKDTSGFTSLAYFTFCFL